jgi:putative glutamine amidotransferase
VQPYLEQLRKVNLEPLPMFVGKLVSLEGARGLLLMGGTDVDPSLYGESAVPETDTPDKERDRSELDVLGRALAINMPILAICRGLQLLNVQQGGTLIQHLGLPKHDPGLKDRSEPAHRVAVEGDSLLAKSLGTTNVGVNSRHHQAVASVGKRLRVVARATDDDVIEGLERPDKQFVLAVQWHPEDQADSQTEHGRLFQSFSYAVAGALDS